MKQRRVPAAVLTVLVLILASVVGCGTAQSTQQTDPTTSGAIGVKSNVTSTVTSLFSQMTPKQWYESGFYMGYWAGNVETLPANPKDLPAVFFSGPTPSAPVRTDTQGNPMQKDPSKVKRPLWVFGDEVRVADYTSQIRQAEKDGRPIIFYATSIPDACRALGLEQHGSVNAPLAGLIVIWPSQMGGNGEVEFMGWNPVTGDQAFIASFIFRQLVEATLNLDATPAGGESSTTYMTAGTTVVSSSETTSISAAKMWGPAPGEPSLKERAQLDALDAAGVVRTYFETMDYKVVYYLSAPLAQSWLTAPNYSGEQRHEGDIFHLVLKGPAAISTDPQQYSKTEWPTQEQFQVEYDLIIPREAATETAGSQIRFVYVARQSADSPWRILSVGTGP